MARKRSKDFNRETDKIRSFEIILYPDTTSYCCSDVLELLKQRFEKYAYITHDRDTDSNGELKKAHIHFYGNRSGPQKISSVANVFGLPDNHINPVFDWDKAMEYALHENDPSKFLYSPSDVTANFDFRKHLKNKSDDASDAAAIFDYICDSNCTDTRKLIRWVLDNGYWGAYRRAASIWRELLYDNRQRVILRYNLSQEVSPEAFNAAQREIFSVCDDPAPPEW